jgi:hypothetical protein
MAAKRSPRLKRDEPPPLPLDVTQEIDPALVEEMLQEGEPTWTQGDFDEITVVLPVDRQPKP